MQTLKVFNNVSLDGYFVDERGDMSWAHRQADDEWNAFSAENASGGEGGLLLFGRVTYELMESYWPTPEAKEEMPVVADAMNTMDKVVFSRSMQDASWQNTRVVNGDIEGFVRKMKDQSGPGMVIMGSGTIVSQLTDARLIDEYEVIVNPIVLGAGRTMFDGVKDQVTASAPASAWDRSWLLLSTVRDVYPRS